MVPTHFVALSRHAAQMPFGGWSRIRIGSESIGQRLAASHEASPTSRRVTPIRGYKGKRTRLRNEPPHRWDGSARGRRYPLCVIPPHLGWNQPCAPFSRQ